ncbi:hypothetical protein GQ457_15G020150 [Hibiscus cannabinus]
MDFITELPSSNGKTMIFVVVDRLSKFGHFTELPSNFTSNMVAEVFVTDIILLHGVQAEIVTDRDARFMPEFWKELHQLQGTTLVFSKSYHPQIEDQMEALKKCLEMYLRCYVVDYPKKWLQFLPWAEYWYNTSYQSFSQMTPFEVLYGRPPPSFSLYIHDSTGNSMVATYMQQRGEIHSVFHVSLLRRCIGIPDQQITPLHLVDSTSGLILQPKALLDTRKLSRLGRVIDQWLIDWECLHPTSATWEDAIHISKKFPDFNLADKVRVNGGSTVVNTSNEATSKGLGLISKSIQ